MSNEEFEKWKCSDFFPQDRPAISPLMAYKAATASKQREIDALNQQVLELSAQVNDLRDFIASEYPDEHGGEHYDADCDVCRILETTPSSALEAHDNEVSAKALEEASQKFMYGVAYELRELAAELRSKK